jgi:hypothetical protein
MKGLRPPNTLKVNVVLGVVLGLALATVTHLYDHRSWPSEYILAGPVILVWSVTAGWLGRRKAQRERDIRAH